MSLRLLKISPKKALNKAFLKLRPNRSEIDLFKFNLIQLLDKVKTDESEEHQKNNIRDFLLHTYYRGINEINTKGRQDLVIHTDNTTQSTVGVIIEAKRPSNKSEWITNDKTNVKALQELVLYYMRERVDGQNIDVKFLIATNIHEWYIFDAANFEKLFYQNKKFVNQYEDWRDGIKVIKDTALFYNDIAKPYIEALDEAITVTYFDIRDYEKILRNEDKDDDRELIALLKLLSQYHLLKVPFANDSNELNSRFYKELLYIIGLEEVKEGGKQIIRRKIKDASEGSMIENTINILKTEDVLLRLKNKQTFGETKDEQLYSVALELNLTWINRILFLKLLEGQLLSYHKNDRKYNFLNKNIIFDYDEMYKLFHQVLAKTLEDRTGSIVEKYKWVPYLNSSLFEISELETQTVKINSLDDHAHLEVMPGSILTQKKNAPLNPLDYLFAFLDAYDFASEGVEDIQEDNRTLINASILGKIFEKINGYKDGSIYTPGFITMYMCRESIRRAVVQKFKGAYGWDIKEFGDIRNYIVDKRSKVDILAFNALINTLRLCDPAVGSGHFLVSALNEIVLIKYELGILCDSEGSRITEYELSIENDELIVSYLNGDIFTYQMVHGKPKSKEDQRLQKTLFYEKQNIIENCLFGVDINPNSVKICRLRLWIELLKNAYYKDETHYAELETLPNIDINIKCGNSLISRFGLDIDLSTVLKSIKYDIKTYRAYVQDYKNCKDREAKRGIEEIINAIKNDFRSEINKKDKDVLRLNALSGELFTLVNQQTMFETEKEQKAKAEKIKKLETDINTLSAKIEDIKSNAVYRDAFEWRFEFPEVLDDEGNFVGFDLVVGNPPYISLSRLKEQSEYFSKVNYKTYSKGADIYCLFYELGGNILKPFGILTYITSNSWLRSIYGDLLKEYFINYLFPIALINIEDVQVFEEATVESNIIMLQKSLVTKTFPVVTLLNDYSIGDSLSEYFKENKFIFSPNSTSDWFIGNQSVGLLKAKFENGSKLLKDFKVRINFGIKTGYNEAFIIDENKKNELIDADSKNAEIIKPIIRGRDLKKYVYEFQNQWVISTFPSLKIDLENYPTLKNYFNKVGKKRLEQSGEKGSRKKTNNKWFETQDTISYWQDFEKPKIIWGEISDKPKFAFDDNKFFAEATTFLMTGEKLKYLLAILNSKVSEWYFNLIGTTTGMGTNRWKKYKIELLPIKVPSTEKEKEIEHIVDRILVSKKLNTAADTTDLESEIDQMVYELYGLTEDEIKVVEGK